METKLLHTIAVIALLSFPKINFSQALNNNVSTSFAMLSLDEKICAAGISQPDDNGTTSSCIRADFDNLAPKKNNDKTTTLVESDYCFKDGQCYSAFIDNQNFPLRGYRPVTATLIAEPADMDGSTPARTMISISIGGSSESANGEILTGEAIELQLALIEPISPESAICHITLHHLTKAYAILKGDASNVEITDFIWSMDRKSFTLSLNFNCTMRSTGFPNDGMKDVNLKGKLVRVHVTDPRVVTASE